MLDKLAEIEKKYEETESLLASAEYISDPAKLREAMKELKKLAPVVEKFREYKDWVKRTKEAEELLSEGDAELKKTRSGGAFREQGGCPPLRRGAYGTFDFKRSERRKERYS